MPTNPDNPHGERRRSTAPTAGGRRRSSRARTIEAIDLDSRRGSLPIPQLKEEEEKFFDLVQAGNVQTAERYLNDHRGININCTNFKGLNVLQIAIINGNEPMVKFLLNRADIDVKDAALHAVDSGNTAIALLVLNHLQNTLEGSEFNGCNDSAEYAPDVTPLSLAAKNSDVEMVRLLLNRGHKLEMPHPSNCLCRPCKAFILQHGAALSTIRLNAFTAICNPAYIFQVTEDPIFLAFVLDNALKECAEMDKEFAAEYSELGQKVREFTVELVNTCRDTSEIEMLLKLGEGYVDTGGKVDFPRLQLALDYNQKEFVAQSLIQQVLITHWLGDFRSWPRLPIFKKMAHILMRLVTFPFICIVLLICPFSKIMMRWTAPVNRYLLSLSSYLFFLIFVFVVNYVDTGNYSKGPPRSGVEGFVVVFVMGHIWTTVRTCWVSGTRRFLTVPWNWYDVVTQFFFVLTFIYWMVSYSDLITYEAQNKEIPERKFWPSDDPTLLHQGFYAIATVLAFGKLAYFCLTSPRLGPFQVSLGKMAIQIALFMLLCLMINVSFAIPLSRLYAYYDGMKQITLNGSTRSQLSSFSTLSNAFATLFWGMFGMSPVESADVVVENLTDDVKNPVVNTHAFTENVGRILFGTYELLMIIALVNTLIAILSNTFQKVVDNADVEFKFARTKIWVKFFDKWTILPSPFNLVPSAIMLKSCMKFFRAASGKVEGGKASFSLRRCCHVKYDKPSDVDMDAYEALMSNLAQRYFAKVQEYRKPE